MNIFKLLSRSQKSNRQQNFGNKKAVYPAPLLSPILDHEAVLLRYHLRVLVACLLAPR